MSDQLPLYPAARRSDPDSSHAPGSDVARLWRIQDHEGRGPFRPGFSHTWADAKLRQGLPPIYEDMPDGLRVALASGMHIGIAVRSEKSLADWFSRSERRRLKRLGYEVVSFVPDRVFAESRYQVLFGCRKPLRNLCRAVAAVKSEEPATGPLRVAASGVSDRAKNLRELAELLLEEHTPETSPYDPLECDEEVAELAEGTLALFRSRDGLLQGEGEMLQRAADLVLAEYHGDPKDVLTAAIRTCARGIGSLIGEIERLAPIVEAAQREAQLHSVARFNESCTCDLCRAVAALGEKG